MEKSTLHSNQAYITATDYSYDDRDPVSVEIKIKTYIHDADKAGLYDRIRLGKLDLEYCEIGFRDELFGAKELRKIKELEEEISHLKSKLDKAVAALTK